MEKVDLDKLEDNINSDLKKQLISSRVLMNNFRFIDESSRRTPAYSDPLFVPFYYYLGKYIKPKTVLEMGFRLGLFSGSFFKSCSTVDYFFAFQNKPETFYSPRLARANVKQSYKGLIDFYVGTVLDNVFVDKLSCKSWDLVIINEEENYDTHRTYLDYIWPNISHEGLVVVDYVNSHKPARDALVDFCKGNNRDPIFFKTRYGVGMVKK